MKRFTTYGLALFSAGFLSNAQHFASSTFAIVFLLAALIFIHELGHFLVAKWAGVRVETFSLGFGKKIWRRTWGETEYCLSLFPLGGYVKMYGDDPTSELPSEDRRRAFLAQSLSKRFAIVLAGPLFNLFFAMFLYVLIPLFGEDVPVPVVAQVEAGSQAELVGLRPGDEIVQVDTAKVDRLSGLHEILTSRIGKPVRLQVKRTGEPDLSVEVRPRAVDSTDVFGDPETTAEIPGISFFASGTFVGVDSSKSWAARMGIKTGDRIVSVNGKALHLWPNLEDALVQNVGQPIVMEVQRADGSGDFVVKDKLPKLDEAGLHKLDLFINIDESANSEQTKLPAYKAGMRTHDHIVEINGQSVTDFSQLRDIVAKAGDSGEKLLVTAVRDGERKEFNLVPMRKPVSDDITYRVSRQWMIGVESLKHVVPSETRVVYMTSPLDLIRESVFRTVDKTSMMVKGFWKLMTGQSSMKALGGPILIADLASRTFKHGLNKFFELMALISVNLFLINLFPIPILDGGHIFVFLTYEALFRRPMSPRWVERFNQIGFIFIMLIMAVTIFNDISRKIS